MGKAFLSLKASRRTVWTVVLTALAVLLVMATVLGAWLAGTRQHYIDQAMENTRGLASSFKSYTEKLVHEMDLTLLVAVQQARQEGRLGPRLSQSVENLFARSLEHMPYVSGLLIIDARGTVVHATSAVRKAALGVDATERDFYRRHIDGPGGTLFVGRLFQPVVFKYPQWRFSLSRRLEGPRGEFLGVVVAMVDVMKLSEEYARHLDNPAASVTLMYLDGTVLSRSPKPAASVGTVLPSFARYQGKPPDSSEFVAVSGVDQVRRLIAQRRLQGMPLLIAVTQLEDRALARWRDTLPAVQLLALLVLLLVLAGSAGAVVLLGRREQAMQALSESEERFHKAFMNNPQAMAIRRKNDDTVIDLNLGFERLTGVSRLAMIGRPAGTLNLLAHPEQREPILSALREQGRVDAAELTLRRGDGRLVQVLSSVEPITLNGEECLLGVFVDITERKRVEEALRQSEQRFRHMVESFPTGVLLVDGHGAITMANALLQQQFGYAGEELLGQQVEVLLPEAARTRHVQERSEYQRVPHGRRMGAGGELVARRKDGSEFPVEIGLQPLNLAEQRLTLVTVADISERRAAEERVRSSLREKEVLIKEIYHRVKNNLQVVASLLNLQMAGAGEEARELLRVSASRVKSIALVHEQLYQSGDLSRIALRPYVEKLLDNLRAVHADIDGRVRLQSDADDVQLGIESAIPLGLVVNELVSNSYKHGFPNSAQGNVQVRLRQYDDRSLVLEVIDDGAGLPAGFDSAQQSSLGMRLVVSLAQQLGGTLDGCCAGARGAHFTLRFIPEDREAHRLEQAA